MFEVSNTICNRGVHTEVIAEGVETEEQQTFLLAEQCENIQGYLIHKPMTEDITTT